MEDAALKVMEAAAAAEALLAEKAVGLGAIRAEFERKQKDVSLPSCKCLQPCMHDGAIHVHVKGASCKRPHASNLVQPVHSRTQACTTALTPA